MRRAATGVVTLVLVLLSACAAIPSSGPVTRVEADEGLGESTVRYSPAGPAVDASPQQVVRGFLDAMLAFPTSTATASLFLTSEAAEEWKPQEGVRVYSGPRVASPVPLDSRVRTSNDGSESGIEVGVDLDERAVLDGQGSYSPGSGETRVTYRLVQVDGEWRIAEPPSGVLVTQKFFDDYYRPFDVYVFDRPGTRLVPEPVHLVVGEQLATSLVSSLSIGPRESDGDTRRTFVPPLAALRPSVPVDAEGTADVSYSSDFGDLGRSERNRLSAQVVWTLRQVPDIQAVRLEGADTVLSTDGSSTQPVTGWAAFGPRASGGQTHAVVGGRVVELDGPQLSPISGAWGEDALGVVDLAVGKDGVAGIAPGRESVRVTSRTGRSARTWEGADLRSPTWDDDGGLWLVDGEGSTRLRIATEEDIATIDIGSLADLDVASLSLSPDRGRYVVTTTGGGGSAIHVGTVVRDADDVVTGLGEPRMLRTGLAEPRSAVWSSGTTVSFLADDGAGMQMHTTRIDGSSTTSGVSEGEALLPDVDARELVVGSGALPPRYVTDAGNRLWYLPPDGAWTLLGSDEATGLTSDR